VKYLRLCSALLLIIVFSAGALAQEVLKESAKLSAPNQSVISSLSMLPEADALIYFNPQRILNEVVPKFMSEKDVAGMRGSFEEVKKNLGVDPARVEYSVLAFRFRKPAADLSFNAPEFISVTGGDFSADSLLTVARLMSGGKLRDETYNGKSISLVTIEPLVKEAEKNPLLKSFTELAIAAVAPNMIAAGSPAYVKAAIDSAAGTGRIDPGSLNSLLRDPNALISAAGSPWGSFSKSFGLLGTEAGDRARCDSQLGNFYVGVTMDATNFMLRGFMNADNPDTAKIISNLIGGLMAHASSASGAATQSTLKSIRFSAEDNDVVLRADFPQQVVLDFIKKQTEPKKPEVTAPATPKKKTPVRRRTRRRG